MTKFSPIVVELLGADSASQDAIDAAASDGAADVLTERMEQVDKHGHGAAHDAGHPPEVLLAAAASYALAAGRLLMNASPTIAYTEGLLQWPWEPSSFKPSPDVRRNLVKAAALLLATIDRIDAERAS